MAKGVNSFRLSNSTVIQIQELYQMKKNEAETSKADIPTKAEIIESAIAMYYAHEMDRNAGNEYLNRITMVVQDAINQSMDLYDAAFNKILFDSEYNKESLLTLLKALDIPKDPIVIEDLVLRKKSFYETTLQKKVEQNLKE